jgi:hypothetical protein
MTPVYGLLLLALLTLILYATWRPSTARKLRRAQKTRMTPESARDAAPTTTRRELTPLDYPTDIAASYGSARRRPGATSNRKRGH